MGGNQNFEPFSFVMTLLWAGNFGWESEFSDFSVGGEPTPDDTMVVDQSAVAYATTRRNVEWEENIRSKGKHLLSTVSA